MSWISIASRRLAFLGTPLLLGASLAWSVNAQTQTAAATSGEGGLKAARQAIETRQAVYKLIGSNFRPLGDVLKGSVKYDAADVEKRIARIAFLAGLLDDVFPEFSNIGEPDTKTTADAWLNHADFDKKLNEFHAHALALVQVNATEKDATEAFKAAITALAQDCKGCHDSYRAK